MSVLCVLPAYKRRINVRALLCLIVYIFILQSEGDPLTLYLCAMLYVHVHL